MIRRHPLPSVRQGNWIAYRERDRSVIFRLGALLAGGLILASGFIYAAEQHFAALRLGYQSEALRRERETMLEEQRRLTLEREAAAAPARLERAARQIGMQPVQPGQIDVAKDGSKGLPANARPVASPDNKAANDSSTGTASAGVD
jgi:cell division protein FtsL